MARKIQMESVECMKEYKKELNHAFVEYNKSATDEEKLHWLAEIKWATNKILLYADKTESILKS